MLNDDLAVIIIWISPDVAELWLADIAISMALVFVLDVVLVVVQNRFIWKWDDDFFAK